MIQFHFIIISKDADSLAAARSIAFTLAFGHTHEQTDTQTHNFAQIYTHAHTHTKAQRVKAKTGSICAICLENSNLSLQKLTFRQTENNIQ